MLTKVPGVVIETIIWGRALDLRILADDLRDRCKWQQFNTETGEFSCAMFEMDCEVLAHIAAHSKPWAFTMHSSWI